MTVHDALALVAYNDWANDRMLSSIDQLSDDQFTRPIGGSFPTIRDTAAHIAASEWVWLRRFRGESPTAAPQWAQGPSAAMLRGQLGEIQTDRAGFVRSLKDADLERPLAFRRLNGEPNSLPIGHLLRHVVNHSTYHRGQVATMIRQVGGTPVSTDLLNFRP